MRTRKEVSAKVEAVALTLSSIAAAAYDHGATLTAIAVGALTAGSAVCCNLVANRIQKDRDAQDALREALSDSRYAETVADAVHATIMATRDGERDRETPRIAASVRDYWHKLLLHDAPIAAGYSEQQLANRLLEFLEGDLTDQHVQLPHWKKIVQTALAGDRIDVDDARLNLIAGRLHKQFPQYIYQTLRAGSAEGSSILAGINTRLLCRIHKQVAELPCNEEFGAHFKAFAARTATMLVALDSDLTGVRRSLDEQSIAMLELRKSQVRVESAVIHTHAQVEQVSDIAREIVAHQRESHAVLEELTRLVAARETASEPAAVTHHLAMRLEVDKSDPSMIPSSELARLDESIKATVDLGATVYSTSIAVVAQLHGMDQEELHRILITHAKNIADEGSFTIERINAHLAAGQFDAAMDSALSLAERCEADQNSAIASAKSAHVTQIEAYLLGGSAAVSAGKGEMAVELFRKAAAAVPKSDDLPEWLRVNRYLVSGLLIAGKLGEAALLQLEIIKLQKELTPADTPDSFDDHYRLCVVFLQARELRHAETCLVHSLRIAKAALDHCDPRNAAMLATGATLKLEQGDPTFAENIARRHLAHLKRCSAIDGQTAQLCFYNLGKSLRLLQRYQEAYPFLRQALELAKQEVSATDLFVAMSLNELGLTFLGEHSLQKRDNRTLYLKGYRLEQAEDYLRRALDLVEGHGDDPSYEVEISYYTANLGRVYMFAGRFEEAQQHFSKALGIRERLLGNEHPKTVELRELISKLPRLGITN